MALRAAVTPHTPGAIRKHVASHWCSASFRIARPATARVRSGIVFALAALACCVSAIHGAEPVRIALRREAAVASAVIRVADLADVTGGDSAVRSRIAAIDVADAAPPGEIESVSRAQLQIRLLLAGWTDRDFELGGADAARVSRRLATLDAEHVIEEITELLANEWQAEPADVEVRLVQPIPADLIDGDWLPEQVRIEPRLPRSVQPGRISASLHVYADSRPLRSAPIAIDAELFRHAARTTRLIPRGEPFTQDNTSSERIRVTGPQAYVALDDALTRAAQRTLAAGVVVQPNDVAAVVQENPIVVRPRDVVRVVARKGKLTVALTAAESLDSGRVGDVIRVRNPTSGKVMSARVVARNELELQL